MELVSFHRILLNQSILRLTKNTTKNKSCHEVIHHIGQHQGITNIFQMKENNTPVHQSSIDIKTTSVDIPTQYFNALSLKVHN